MYKQCKLKNKDTFLVTWIPQEFAVKNKIISLKNNNKWENGWKVISVGNILLDEKTLIANSQDYKKTRLVSDI